MLSRRISRLKNVFFFVARKKAPRRNCIFFSASFLCHEVHEVASDSAHFESGQHILGKDFSFDDCCVHEFSTSSPVETVEVTEVHEVHNFLHFLVACVDADVVVLSR